MFFSLFGQDTDKYCQRLNLIQICRYANIQICRLNLIQICSGGTMWLETTPLSSVVQAAETSKLPGCKSSKDNELDHNDLEYSGTSKLPVCKSSKFKTASLQVFKRQQSGSLFDHSHLEYFVIFKTARLQVFKRQRAGSHFDYNLLQFSAAGLYSSRFETIALNIL